MMLSNAIPLAQLTKHRATCRRASVSFSRGSAVCAASKGFGKAAPAPAPERTCACGSGASYAQCCGAYHVPNAAPEPSAEAVLRARYSAYVKGDAASLDYIVSSTHPRSPDFKARAEGEEESPAAVQAARAQLRKDAAVTARNLTFTKLSVVSVDKGGNELEAWVTFRASYTDNTARANEPRLKSSPARWKDDKESVKMLSQRARFLKDAQSGRWLYFGGTLMSPSGLGSYESAPAAAPTPSAAPPAI